MFHWRKPQQVPLFQELPRFAVPVHGFPGVVVAHHSCVPCFLVAAFDFGVHRHLEECVVLRLEVVLFAAGFLLLVSCPLRLRVRTEVLPVPC